MTDVSRRHILHLAAAGTTTALSASVPGTAAAQPTKSPQEVAGYRNSPNGEQRCGTCLHFQAPSSCKVVAGKISAQGWCRIYFPKS